MLSQSKCEMHAKKNCFMNPNLNRATPDMTVGTEAGISLCLEGIYLEGVPAWCTVSTRTRL
jgi:hypothetical protein